MPDATQQTLQELAQQQGKTMGEIVQEAIQLYFLSVQKKQPKSIGIGKSNLTDLSERVDELAVFEASSSTEQTIDRRAFLRLHLAERQQILASQCSIRALSARYGMARMGEF